MALLSVAEALARVLAEAEPLASERVALAAAHGRVLTQDLAAQRTQPPADVSAMDGYAVRAADLAGGPARLLMVGEIPAGRCFDHVLKPGETARIFTGGVIPSGADTVVVQEVATRDGDHIALPGPTQPGRHVRRHGRDFAAADVLLRRGQRLSMRDLALVAAMNHPTVPVHRQARVGLLATGDELVMPGASPAPDQIVYSNGFALAALARAEGVEVVDFGIVPDSLAETTAAVRSARDADLDVLVTTGGASVGDYDLVQQAFTAEGMALSFWKVALRPGRPLMHGRIGPMHVLGLPGNPVSSFVCAVLFLVPLLRRLHGRADVSFLRESAVAGCDLAGNDEREDFQRATLAQGPDGRLVVTPVADQDSSLLRPLAQADALLIRPPHAAAVPAGSPCEVIRLPL